MSTKDQYKTTYHRDGTVTLWNVYTQGWMRVNATKISDAVLSSLSDAERRRHARVHLVGRFGTRAPADRLSMRVAAAVVM